MISRNDRHGLQVTRRGIDEMRAKLFNNSSDNQGKYGGIHVKLEEIQRNIAERENRPFKELIEKGCSDHIAALTMTGWEKSIANLEEEWGLEHLKAPPDYQQYQNRFTVTMKRISKRFREGSWRAWWSGFLQLLGEKPFTVEKVTSVHFGSTDAVACQVLQAYFVFCSSPTQKASNTNKLNHIRYIFFYLWYRYADSTLTDKDW